MIDIQPNKNLIRHTHQKISPSESAFIFDFPSEQKTLLHRGFDNEIWLINDGWQKKTLRVCRPDTKSYSDLEREFRISQELQSRHLPLTNIEQIGFYIDHDHQDMRLPAMLVDYIEGQPLQPTPDKPLTLTQIKTAANLLAQIHLQTRNFPQHPATGSLNLFLSVGLVSPIKKLIKNKTNFQLFFPQDINFIDEIKQFLAHPSMQNAKDVCWLHNDYRPENTIWKKNLLNGVIDLDYSIVGPRIYDLAQSMLLWSISPINSEPDLPYTKPIIRSTSHFSSSDKKKPTPSSPSTPIMNFVYLNTFFSNYQSNFSGRSQITTTAEIGWWLKFAVLNRTALVVNQIMEREPFYPPRHLSDLSFYQASQIL